MPAGFYAFPIIFFNMSSAKWTLLNSTEISCDFLFSICLLLSLCSLLLLSCFLLGRILSDSLWLDRSANFCLMLLTFFFVDSLSNPLFIVTICVPKRRVEMICVDYQTIMLCMPKVDGVENEESMWKHSSKVGECKVPNYIIIGKLWLSKERVHSWWMDSFSDFYNCSIKSGFSKKSINPTI